ncbi:MAG: NAD-dependent succinate-semialdehyde dehydrogenase [Actinomycetaceae bacterium]|nr:NAD-dependent succinate-semialdehyde dehydrogenase [Actinomycetaceae bacterium]
MTFATVNPFTNETLKEFEYFSDEQVEHALALGEATYRTWRTTSFAERAELARSIAEKFKECSAEFNELLALEMGKVSGKGAKSLTGFGEARLCASIFEYYADNAERQLAPRQLEDAAGYKAVLTHEPTGIIYAIEPWNYPLYQVVRVLAPQMMAGNVVVLKHAENVPQIALALEKLVHDAGAPEGLFQNLFISHDQSKKVIEDDRVRGVALTGSERAGRVVAAQAGAALKKVTLELGGSDPFIVLDDANVDKAARHAVSIRMENSGQMCVACKRFIVHSSLVDSFLEAYRKHAADYVPGDPRDPETTFAPLNSQRQADTVKDQVERAVAAGAEFLPMGPEVPSTGAFVGAGILRNVAPENPVYYEEIFGPVGMLFSFDSDEEAVRIANDSPYGLGGAVFGGDLQRAKGVAEQIETGYVHINRAGSALPQMPFGGVKNSGFGRELSDLGIREFVATRWITDVDAKK